MRRFPHFAAVVSVFVVLMTVTAAPAAYTSEGTISPSNPSFSWSSTMPATSYIGAGCQSAKIDPQNLTCDHVSVTVNVPRGYWKLHHGSMRVVIQPGAIASIPVLQPGTTASFNLFVYDSKSTLVGDASSNGNPTVTVFDPAGRYEIDVVGFDINDSYAGTATFKSMKGKDPGFPISGFSAYHAVSSQTLPANRVFNKPIRYHGPKLALSSHYVGHDAAEPTVGMGSQGVLFYAAAAFDALPSNVPAQEPRTLLMRSSDRGNTWEVDQPPFANGSASDGSTTTDGEPATLDPYVYVDPDTGRVFMIDLKGSSSTVDHSDDGGATWTRSVAMSPGVNDHQTVDAAPVPAGSQLVTLDSKFPKVLYYCVNQIASATCARSLDGGLTFQNTGQPAFTDPVDSSLVTPNSVLVGNYLCGSLHGHIRNDPEGRIFIPRAKCGTPVLAMSGDAGTSWSELKVADASFKTTPDPSVASDSQGNLYYVFFDGTYALPWLTISRDHGTTWSAPMMIAPPDVHETNFPVVAAGDPGHVAITFPGSTSDDPTDMTRTWSSYVVESTNALASNPTFISNVANVGGAKNPVHRGFCAGRCGPMFDFLDIHIEPDSVGTVIATAVDTCTDLNKCDSIRGPGNDRLTGSWGVASDARGVFIRQLKGPRMRERPAQNT